MDKNIYEMIATLALLGGTIYIIALTGFSLVDRQSFVLGILLGFPVVIAYYCFIEIDELNESDKNEKK